MKNVDQITNQNNNNDIEIEWYISFNSLNN